MRRGIKLGLGFLTIMFLAGASGYIWLRNSPYWAGLTLFTEANRIENFRAMDTVFPARDVKTGDQIWTFEKRAPPAARVLHF
ncbi:MAG: hypothetical protein AAGF23_06860 [Acidobacteriota bacterium]